MKLGLVLEGGAFRSIYSCGVTDALLDKDIIADYLIGTSAGIAFGVSYASNQPGRNYEVVTKYGITGNYMGLKHFINPKKCSYFNLQYVYDEIPNVLAPFDYDAFAAFKGDVKAVATNVDTGKAEYLDVSRKPRQLRPLIASCALPLLSPIVMYKGKGYLDGGISDPIPYKQAIKDGCDKLIIVLTREYDYIKSPSKTLKHALVHYRKYPELCAAFLERCEMYNQCVEEIKELENDGKAFVFRPQSVKGFSRTERDLNKIRELYNDGYLTTLERLDELKEYLQKE